MSEYIITCDDEVAMWVGNDVESMKKIVRCRDCKNFEQDGEPSEVFPNSYWCDKLTVYMPPNGFCSWGKDGRSNEHE